MARIAGGRCRTGETAEAGPLDLHTDRHHFNGNSGRPRQPPGDGSTNPLTLGAQLVRAAIRSSERIAARSVERPRRGTGRRLEGDQTAVEVIRSGLVIASPTPPIQVDHPFVTV